MLLQRYALPDVAFKVVGVGSVGILCDRIAGVWQRRTIATAEIKEAQQSVLAPFAGASDYSNQGQRVVVGQRMLQAATDADANRDSTSGGSGIRGSPISARD